MSEEEKILIEAIGKLKNLKLETNNKIVELESKKISYISANEEINDEDLVEVYTKDINSLTESLEGFKSTLDQLDDFYKAFKNQEEICQNVINFSSTLGKIEDLTDLLKKEHYRLEKDVYESFVVIAKISGVKLPFGLKEVNEANETNKLITMQMFQLLPPSNYTGKIVLDSDKAVIIEQIKKNHLPLLKFYTKILTFATQVRKSIEKRTEKLAQEIQNIRTSEVEKRKKEIEDNIKEIDEKIEFLDSKMNTINEIYLLYADYKETGSQEDYIQLIVLLSKIDLITSREVKKLTHQTIEKEETVIEEKKEVKEEITGELETIYELDSDYFRRPSTKHIICFLGDKDNEIFDDIDYHFDGKNKLSVLTEMENLFNFLYLTEINNDNYKETGGNPKYFSDKLAKALTSSPLDFGYRRYGVGKDQYRIHAIVRHSDLLHELGYGSGNIIFFGAVGVNDTTKKSDAYHRIGSRAIESLSSGGGAPKLRTNFDYIEHITKKQIPFDLLSDEDKSRKKNGNFNGKIKGTKIDKSYEGMKYYYYDILDANTKNNVKKYLDNYFIEQTNSMFEILDERKKLKGDTLD